MGDFFDVDAVKGVGKEGSGGQAGCDGGTFCEGFAGDQAGALGLEKDSADVIAVGAWKMSVLQGGIWKEGYIRGYDGFLVIRRHDGVILYWLLIILMMAAMRVSTALMVGWRKRRLWDVKM